MNMARHRSLPRMLRTTEEAIHLLRKRGVVSLAHAPGITSLVEEVAGGRITGSWWGHPKGRLIFRIASALEDHPDALGTKITGGRAAFVHRSLWPALVRVVTDPGWRRGRVEKVSTRSRSLLDDVEEEGRLRLDRHRLARTPKGRTELRRARLDLEKQMLVHARSEHAESGRHAAVLQSWTTWATSPVKKQAKAQSLEKALDELRSRGIQV